MDTLETILVVVITIFVILVGVMWLTPSHISYHHKSATSVVTPTTTTSLSHFLRATGYRSSYSYSYSSI